MSTPRHSEAAFETVIEHHLLGHGYVAVSHDGFDRERPRASASTASARCPIGEGHRGPSGIAAEAERCAERAAGPCRPLGF
jgi:hypothetical protein